MRAIGRLLGEILTWVVVGLMVILTIVVVVGVTYRKLGDSLSWYDEVASVLLVWITYYGAALAALKRSHIGFDDVLRAMPVALRKLAVVVAEILVILFFGLLTWAGIRVIQVLAGDTLVSLTWVPTQFTHSVIPIGSVLFIIAELLSLPDYWADVMAGRSTEHSTMTHGATPDGEET